MLRDMNRNAVEYICLNMRASDHAEIFAVRSTDCPLRLAWEASAMVSQKGRGQIAWHDGRPAVFAALVELHPGVWSVSMFGTDDFKPAALPLMRWFRETMAELMRDWGARRLYCDSLISHFEAHAFLRRMGARREGEPMRLMGKNGEIYVRFVWLADEQASQSLAMPMQQQQVVLTQAGAIT